MPRFCSRFALLGLILVEMLCITQRREAMVIINFAEMIRTSQLILIAHVDKVINIQGEHVALATVARTLKGRAPTRLAFYAEPTWTCDTSKAVQGETVLLCLRAWTAGINSDDECFKPGPAFEAARKKQLAGRPFYMLMSDGRGRMPVIRERRRLTYLRQPPSCKFPTNIPVGPTSKDGHSLYHLQDVKKAIKQILQPGSPVKSIPKMRVAHDTT